MEIRTNENINQLASHVYYDLPSETSERRISLNNTIIVKQ